MDAINDGFEVIANGRSFFVEEATVEIGDENEPVKVKTLVVVNNHDEGGVDPADMPAIKLAVLREFYKEQHAKRRVREAQDRTVD